MIKPGERYACKIWTIISQCSLTEIANSFFQVSDHHVPDISALRPCCSRHDLPLLSMLRERPIFKHFTYVYWKICIQLSARNKNIHKCKTPITLQLSYQIFTEE